MNTHHGLDVEFRPLVIPTDLNASDAADFVEMTRVRNEVYAEIGGSDDDSYTAAQLLPHYRPDPDETRLIWVVIADGRLIGRVGVDIPHEEGSRSAYWLIELLRSHHGRGIGTAAYQLVERAAREHGRTVLQSWAQHPAQERGSADRLSAPTGFGEIPLDRAARFYLANGYTLEQIERRSELDLVASEQTVLRLLADAEKAAAGYRVVQWTAPTPPEHVEGFAWMKSRMSTDAPAAGMEFDEERWDAERVARHEQRWLDGGMTAQVTAAQHIDSGALVAFNELVIGEDRTRPTEQQDTLVLKEHRGHRLGQLVKCAALVSWRRFAPLSPKVITYNAEENRPMLDINEAIGFRPAAYEGAWKKVVEDA
jgi:GNAT superfamily N-acetyltransferase